MPPDKQYPLLYGDYNKYIKSDEPILTFTNHSPDSPNHILGYLREKVVAIKKINEHWGQVLTRESMSCGGGPRFVELKHFQRINISSDGAGANASANVECIGAGASDNVDGAGANASANVECIGAGASANVEGVGAGVGASASASVSVSNTDTTDANVSGNRTSKRCSDGDLGENPCKLVKISLRRTFLTQDACVRYENSKNVAGADSD